MKISACIITLNEEKNISNLLDDLITQTIDKNNFEVIISNDRSEDETGKIDIVYFNSIRLNT